MIAPLFGWYQTVGKNRLGWDWVKPRRSRRFDRADIVGIFAEMQQVAALFAGNPAGFFHVAARAMGQGARIALQIGQDLHVAALFANLRFAALFVNRLAFRGAIARVAA
jgi:hypothetical protein